MQPMAMSPYYSETSAKDRNQEFNVITHRRATGWILVTNASYEGATSDTDGTRTTHAIIIFAIQRGVHLEEGASLDGVALCNLLSAFKTINGPRLMPVQRTWSGNTALDR